VTPSQFRTLRQNLGLSQSTWAEMLGIHRVTVARIEVGTRAPSETLQRLAEAIVQGYRRAGVDTSTSL